MRRPPNPKQMVGICGVEKSLQAEEALTQGSGCLADDANIGSFVAIALGKLSSLEGFVIQENEATSASVCEPSKRWVEIKWTYVTTTSGTYFCFLLVVDYIREILNYR
ncbi:transcription factor TGAL4-like isoform X2 [Lolium perenne]|uniref:transcription factor TGAL4-like isoform X2 n=1 Tax=Lolium perenne TaxID=4522 RepID=UPI003A9A3704